MSQVMLRLLCPQVQRSSILRRSFHQTTRLLKDVTVSVPPIGRQVKKATVAAFNYELNQNIQAGEAVVTLETPDINIEVAGPVNGKIVQILVGKGDSVGIGDDLFVVREEHINTRKLVYSDFVPQRVNNIYEPFSMVVHRASEWATSCGRHLVNVETVIAPTTEGGSQSIQMVRAWAFE